MATRRDDNAPAPGRSGWDGGLGISWLSDPKEDVVGMVFAQRVLPLDIYRDFSSLARHLSTVKDVSAGKTSGCQPAQVAG